MMDRLVDTNEEGIEEAVMQAVEQLIEATRTLERLAGQARTRNIVCELLRAVNTEDCDDD
jgi:uncharacterized iron-regulated protein